MTNLQKAVMRSGHNGKECAQHLKIGYSTWQSKIHGRLVFTLPEALELIDFIGENVTNIRTLFPTKGR